MTRQGRCVLRPDESGRILDRLAGLEKIIAPGLIRQVLFLTNRCNQRACTLTHEVMMWVVMAMGILTDLPIREVFRHARRLRMDENTPHRSSLCVARQRLGAVPLRCLFQEVVRPLAMADTPGVLLRLASDGHRWHRHGPARHARQREDVWASLGGAGRRGLSTNPQTECGRVGHARGSRPSNQALHGERTGDGAQPAAPPDARHAADLGPQLFQLQPLEKAEFAGNQSVGTGQNQPGSAATGGFYRMVLIWRKSIPTKAPGGTIARAS